MRSLVRYIVFFSLCIAFQGCGKKQITDPKAYVNWMNDEAHGLVRTRYINGVRITVKYLTPEYQAFQELANKKGRRAEEKDSLVDYYSKSRSFLLTIGPDDRKTGKVSDIMWREVGAYEEYKERNLTMNFSMDEFLTLDTDKGSYRPVLANLENVYGLGNDRNIYLVFTPDQEAKDLQEAEHLDLVFNDEIFNTGISHFVFTKEQLESIPGFIF